jgi:UDP-GlcNAc:undecaprenyl-phosphate GlcNAc-1-phosphate transferase
MTLVTFLFFFVLIAAAATLVGTLIPVFTRMAVRRGFADHPDDARKDHGRAVPPLGGIVIVPIFLLLLPFLGFPVGDYLSLYAAVTLLYVTGFIDDSKGLSPALKLGVQVVCALIVTVSGTVSLDHLGHLFGSDHLVELSFISIPFTVVCFIFFMNALNMIDGVDGLSGGLSFIMLLFISLSFLWAGHIPFFSGSVLLMALLVGFLIHNMRYPGHKRATVFMGDTGTLCMGFLIAWLGISSAMTEGAGITPIGFAFVILLPIMDAFALFIARKRRGISPFTAGRDHLHHILLNKWYNPLRVTLALWMMCFLLGLIGFIGPHVGITEGVLTFLWVGLLLGYTAYQVWKNRERIHKGCG